MTDPLLEVRDLVKHYPITEGFLRREVGRVRAVDGVSFDVARGETVGLVGESGCGKSTTARALLRLEEPTSGTVRFDGEDVTGYDKRELKRFRRRAQMIFQDPTSSFDPRMSAGESVAEPLRVHGLRDRERRRRIVADLFERVGLSAEDVDRYPHEFSGGQKQRIALARALSVNPELIVADEPVSALDVSIQASILSLMEDIQATFDLSLLFISHDMGVVREICDRVAVMYLGEIVERGPTEAVFEDPAHPYTRALLASIPQPDPSRRRPRVALTGDVPDPADPPPGCRFHTRCPAIIGPGRYDLDPETWRATMDLRVRLRDEGIDLDAVRTFTEIGHDADGTGGADGADEDAMKRAIRGEFGLPARLDDARAEAVVDDALDRIVAGEEAAGREVLAEAFATPCEDEAPAWHDVGDGHAATCHRHDGRFADRIGEIAASEPEGE